MSESIWKRRMNEWCNGYYVSAYELMNAYKDWELDPMCDCAPSRTFWFHSGEWEIEVHKVFIEDRLYEHNGKWKSTPVAHACSEVSCRARKLSKEVAERLWLDLTKAKTTMKNAKEYCKDAEIKAEAVRLMP